MTNSSGKDFKKALLPQDSSILEALKIIDQGSLQITLVVDEDGKLLGTVTDGDIRRGILNNIKLEDPVIKIMNPDPYVASTEVSDEENLALMIEKKIHQLPIVDGQQRVQGMAQMDALVKRSTGVFEDQESVSIVLMLGGMGTRLMPLTEDTPKPMIPVGGKPLLETIVSTFTTQGFKNFYFSVNYKAEKIEEHFGDGLQFNASIEYLHESEPLGTAGALSLLPEDIKTPLIVMNGDILTGSNFNHLMSYHKQTKALATMCVREYQQQVPYGIVQTDGTKLESITEKPMQSYFVNAGIYVLEPAALKHVPKNQHMDMPSLFDVLQNQDQESSVFPIREYWIDIGSPDDLERAREEYSDIFGQNQVKAS